MDFLSLVAKLTLDSSEYEGGLKKAQGLATALGGGIKTGLKVAGAAIAGATTAVVGFATASVKTGADFDKSMSQVAATMGLSMDEMKNQIGTVDTAWGEFNGNLRDYAQFMGSNTAFSATEAADALNYMALAGYDAQTSMQMLPNVLNLAAAGNMDLARASDMVTDTQTAFGISLERTSQMVDEMAKASSTGNTSVEQLGDAFLTVGGLAQELNGGIVTLADGTTQSVDGVQELEIALTAMANAGIKGSEAGTHMRNMLLKLSSPTDDGTAALEAMGVAVFDTEGKMRSLTDIMGDLSMQLGSMSQEDAIQTISDLFNTRDMASAKSLLNAVTQQFVKMGDEIYSIDEAYEKFGDDIYDSSKGFEIVRSSWDQIGEAILEAGEGGVLYEGKLYSMNEAQEKFGDAINDTSKGFKILGAAEAMALKQLDNLDGDVTYFNSALDGLKITISDQLTPSLREFVQFGTKGLSEITSAFKEGGIEGAMQTFGTILSDGLKMITTKLPDAVNAGLELLGAVGKGIVDNADVIIESLVEVGGLLAEKAVVLAENIAEGLDNFDWGTAVENVVNFIVTALTSDKATRFMEAGISIVGSLIEGIIQGAPKIIDGAMTLISKFTEGLSQDTTGLVDAAIKIVTDFTTYISEHLGEISDLGVDIILALVEGILNSIPTLIESIPIIVENLSTAFNASLPRMGEVGIGIINNLVLGLINAIPSLIASLPQIIVAIVNVMTTFNWANIGAQIIQGISNGMQNFAKELPDKLKQIAENAKTTFMDTDWIRAGIDSITKIAKGISQLAKEIPDKIKEIADNVVKLWENRDWLGLGKYLVEGIWSGISGAYDWITQRISEWAGNVFEWFQRVFKIGSPSKLMRDGVGKWLGYGVAEGIENSMPVVKNAISDMTDLVEEPDISASLDITKNSMANNGSDSQFKENQKINALAEAIVDAFVKADIGVDIDGREFGRLVRKAVTV